MTKAQAATITSALITAGYAPTLRILNGEYTVSVYVEDQGGATTNSVQTLATNNGVSVRVKAAEYY
jgi:hypothetical protein